MGRPTFAKATAGPGVVGAAKFFCGRPTFAKATAGPGGGWCCEVFCGRPTFAEATAGPGVVGSAKFFYGPIAQSVEQLAFNQWVGGSNPPRLSFLPMRTLLKRNYSPEFWDRCRNCIDKSVDLASTLS